MVTIFVPDSFEMTAEMKQALSISVILHVGVLVFGIVGLPYISKPPMISQPIAIEIINPADITTTNKPPTQNKLKPVVEKPKKAPKVEKKMEAPPKVDVKEPPKLEPLEKPKEKKKNTVKPKAKTLPLPSEKLEEPKPEKKVEEDKEEAVQQEDPMQSLLKNYADPEEFSETEGLDELAEASPDAPFSEYITQNELGALTNQLIGCWQIPIGAKDIQNMVVTAHIWVNPDRTVRKVEIKDQFRISSDPAFAALAQSVRWAIESPACSPLDIPEEKYEVWKNQYIEVPFDPSHVT